ncbi:MAG: hypothetical protein GY835_23480, partial [bacterium]|nr:hypothetical protein [bacterium]
MVQGVVMVPELRQAGLDGGRVEGAVDLDPSRHDEGMGRRADALEHAGEHVAEEDGVAQGREGDGAAVGRRLGEDAGHRRGQVGDGDRLPFHPAAQPPGQGEIVAARDVDRCADQG